MNMEEYSIAGVRIAIPGKSAAGAFGRALTPFKIQSAQDGSKADLILCVGEVTAEADDYKRLDKFNFADANAACCFGHDKYGYLLTMSPRNGEPAVRFRKESDSPTAICSITEKTNPALFRFGLWTMFNLTALRRNAVAVHSSVIGIDGRAVLVLGESGTGKSTHTRLWRENIAGAELLNDDSPILRTLTGEESVKLSGNAGDHTPNGKISESLTAQGKTPDCAPQGQQSQSDITDTTVAVYGSPWSGKTPCYRNLCYPVAAIIRLSQAPRNGIRRLRPIEAIGALLPSCPPAFAHDEQLQDAICRLVSHVVASIPVYHLECLPDAAAAELAYNTIFNVPAHETH